MRIEHIALWTYSLEKMRAFYQQYFEATPNEKYVNPTKGFESYFLTFGTGARLELMQMEGIAQNPFLPDQQHTGFIHFAMSVGSEAEVDRLTEQLRTDGFPIIGEPRTTGDGYYESVVLDPDGNRIEITV
ncbi:MAG: VOC family protein [Bacteroidota bacterium]